MIAHHSAALTVLDEGTDVIRRCGAGHTHSHEGPPNVENVRFVYHEIVCVDISCADIAHRQTGSLQGNISFICPEH